MIMDRIRQIILIILPIMLFSNTQNFTYNFQEMYLLFSMHGPLFTCFGVKGWYQRIENTNPQQYCNEKAFMMVKLSITNNIQYISTYNSF